MARLVKILLAALGVLLVVEVAFSLQWRIEHDTPTMFYVAFLIDRFGFVPYRDVFDLNMPGTFLAYVVMGRLSSYTDIGYRLCDLAILGLLSLCAWLWMRRLGRRVAW